MNAHFVVSSIEGSLVTICGSVIAPSDVDGSRVGIYGQMCKECETKVKQAWVTVK